MLLKRPTRLILWLAALCLLGSAPRDLRAADGRTVAFEGSIRKVPQSVVMGPNDPRLPYISRSELKPAEAAEEMRFEVALKMRNFAELHARVARGEQIPFAEMSEKYFPTQADYQAVAAWLTAQGFKITRRDDSRLALFASGSVDAVHKGLHVNFARVALEGKEYTSAVSAPGIPVAISPAIVSINGLQPHLRARKHIVARPNSLTGTSQPYTPAQLLKPYGASGLGLNGAGQTIAIVIDVFPLTTDLTKFWNSYGINNTTPIPQSLNNISLIQVVSGSLAGPSGEESLDTEWSSSIAPAAKVRVYATFDLADADLDAGYQQVYSDVINHPEYNIHQMSMSYGIAENATSAGQVFTDTQYFAELASAGVTVFASSGDNANSPDGVCPESPASDPYVTGVGGTSLTLTSGSNINTEVSWNDSGGGTSIFFSRPTWQTGTGVPAGTTRCVPDVAAPADPNEGAYVTLNGAQQVYGGTSWSSPTWAGFCALINQARANASLPPIGDLAPKLYAKIGTNNFHDITSGNNGYAAGTGYDLVTGIGSPNLANLVPTLVAMVPTVATNPTESTLTPGQNATFTVNSSGTGAGYTYQWQRMSIGSSSWSNLSDTGGTYAGSATSSLTVNGVTTAMSGDEFHCVVTTGTGTITTAPPSTLVVDTQLVVTTLAGQALNAGWEDGSGTNAIFAYPSGAAVDGSGNVYIADFESDTIRKITPAGLVSTPYGQAGVTGTANGTGTNALFDTPNSVAIDSNNNIYVADSGNSTIRKINTSGSVSLFAGRPGRTGATDAMGLGARFNNPQGVGVDSAGNVYVADTGNNLIRKINTSGSVSTLAGNSGTLGWLDGTGTAAVFNGPTSVAADSSGNIYVGDFYTFVIRKITPAGVVTTPYGQPGVLGSTDGTGTNALFNSPVGLFIDGSNNIYVSDSQVPLTPGSPVPGNTVLRRINTSGVVSTIAGTPNTTGTNDGVGPAAQFDSLQFSAVNSSGVVYMADTYNQLIRVGGVAPLVTTVQGSQTVNTGNPATFAVSTAGSGSITYQWYFSGSAITGANSASYTIPSASGSNAGTYTLVATDPYGSGTSSTYTLTVNTEIPDLSYWMLVVLAASFIIAANAFMRENQRKT